MNGTVFDKRRHHLCLPVNLPGLRNNHRRAHCINATFFEESEAGKGLREPYGDPAEADPGFVGPAAYVILVALFKKTRAKSIASRTRGHGTPGWGLSNEGPRAGCHRPQSGRAHVLPRSSGLPFPLALPGLRRPRSSLVSFQFLLLPGSFPSLFHFELVRSHRTHLQK